MRPDLNQSTWRNGNVSAWHEHGADFYGEGKRADANSQMPTPNSQDKCSRHATWELDIGFWELMRALSPSRLRVARRSSDFVCLGLQHDQVLHQIVEPLISFLAHLLIRLSEHPRDVLKLIDQDRLGVRPLCVDDLRPDLLQRRRVWHRVHVLSRTRRRR